MKKFSILFIVIIFLSLALRLFQVSSTPAALNWDEISHGYNAYSLLHTGADEWGQPFPIANFRAYGDYPLPLNLYITAPFIAALGLNELSIRLPHVILGVLTVIATYFLATGLAKKKELGLVAAFLVAIDPWHVFTSRFVLQSNLSVFLLTLALSLFVHRERKRWFLPLSVASFGLSLFSYHSTRIFVPLLVVAIVLIYRKAILTRASIGVFLLFFLPLPFILLSPEARARSTEVFLLNPGVIAQIEENRNISELPNPLPRLVYNRPVYLAQNFLHNYVEYFSPQFLFFEGGTQYQFSVPHQGLLLLPSLPFFYIGLASCALLAIRKKEKSYKLLLAWLLLAPLPASITTEHFAVVRATTMLPLPEIFVAIGLFSVLPFLKRKFRVSSNIALLGFIILSLVACLYYLTVYFSTYRTNYSWAWQFGYKEAVIYAKENYSKYDKVIITKKYGEPHEYVLFYWPWSPSAYKSDSNLIRYTQSNWWWVDGFDKFVFVNDWQIPTSGSEFITESKNLTDCASLACLLITSPENAPSTWKKLDTIYFLDHSPAFELYDNR